MSRWRQGRILAALLMFTACSTAVWAQTAPYHKVAPFPEPAEEVLGIGANGKVYVFAGLDEVTPTEPRQIPKGLVYEYDPARDAWTKKKKMPVPAHHIALAELNGKIYVFGGFKAPDEKKFGWVPINNSWEYDPGQDSWKALKAMPTTRGSAAAAVVEGKIYVIGGGGQASGVADPVLVPDGSNRSLSANEEYDPASDSWRERAPLPTARNHTAAAAVNGKIYVIGGRIGAPFIGTSRNTDIVETYDPATDRWSVGAAFMPTARSGHAAGVYKGRIFVAGGEQRDRRMVGGYITMEAYDPATNSWNSLPSMTWPRGGFAGAIAGNRFYMMGGTVQAIIPPGMDLGMSLDEAYDLDSAFK